MLSDTMVKALNDQINAELHSAYLYLSMVAHFESENLAGFAHWMQLQAQEEVAHAMKLFQYVNNRGCKVVLTQIEGPATTWDSPLAAFQDAYDHEVMISGMINSLVELAIQENDHATNTMLQWFVTEQVEEEASADAVVQKLKLVGTIPISLFMLDRELGERQAGA